MGEPYDAEMAAIQGGDLALTETLDNRQDRSVDEAESEVRVGRGQLLDPFVVTRLEILDLESAPTYVVQETSERRGGDEVVQLHQHGCRDDAAVGPAGQKLRAGLMILIVAVEERDQRTGVDYERNGGGEYSSLAWRAKSSPPEANDPAQ